MKYSPATKEVFLDSLNSGPICVQFYDEENKERNIICTTRQQLISKKILPPEDKIVDDEVYVFDLLRRMWIKLQIDSIVRFYCVNHPEEVFGE